MGQSHLNVARRFRVPAASTGDAPVAVVGFVCAQRASLEQHADELSRELEDARRSASARSLELTAMERCLASAKAEAAAADAQLEHCRAHMARQREEHAREADALHAKVRRVWGGRRYRAHG